MPSVDIVVTTYRNSDKLRICLNSIVQKTKFIDYRVYVMANDPNEDIKKAIHDSIFIDDIQFTDRIIPIYNDSNDGSFSSNNNELASEGTGDYILFLNDDIEILHDDWLLNMSTMLNDQSIGVVGALLFYPNKLIQHCGVFFSDKTNNLPFHMHYRKKPSEVKKYISVPRYYQAVTGACMLVRRNDFEAVGGFNEEFYYCYEDIGLCLDIKDRLNKKSIYTPKAALIHHEGISSSSKNNPYLKKNIEVFKKNYYGKYYNDLEFYLSNPNFMVYK